MIINDNIKNNADLIFRNTLRSIFSIVKTKLRVPIIFFFNNIRITNNYLLNIHIRLYTMLLNMTSKFNVWIISVFIFVLTSKRKKTNKCKPISTSCPICLPSCMVHLTNQTRPWNCDCSNEFCMHWLLRRWRPSYNRHQMYILVLNEHIHFLKGSMTDWCEPQAKCCPRL